MIGIFWIHKETVIGKAIDIIDGEEYAPGVADSPDNHTDFWDDDKEYRKSFPELRFSEYFDVPRGRVLFDRNKEHAIVYMDKTLFNDHTKQIIIDFFKLIGTEIAWRTDPHYTICSDEIDQLLE